MNIKLYLNYLISDVQVVNSAADLKTKIHYCFCKILKFLG